MERDGWMERRRGREGWRDLIDHAEDERLKTRVLVHVLEVQVHDKEEVRPYVVVLPVCIPHPHTRYRYLMRKT